MIDCRPFTAADIDYGMRLKNLQNWNQTRADWERILELNPGGSFLGILDGEPAGTVTGIVLGDMGWVGMMLVDPGRRRMGIGRALLEREIRHLRDVQGCASVRLDATPLGKKLYDTMGFADEYRLERRLRPPGRLAAPGLPPVAPSDIEALLAFDREAFGYDRSALLRHLLSGGFSALARDGGGIRGYVLGRPGHAADFVGPWVARDRETAEALFRAALAAMGERPLYVDVTLPNAGAVEISARYGFAPQREFIRMGLGGLPPREDLRRVLSSAGPELG